MKKIVLMALVIVFFTKLLGTEFPEIPIVVIIPSYNNEEWTEKTISSVLDQEYGNFRVIFIDDASTDRNFAIAQEVVAQYHAESRVTLVHNKVRCGALANTYAAIHSCDDNELWIVLDGDDWFPHNQALATFNKYYYERDAWASFGQYVDWPVGKVGHAEAFPDEVIRANKLRSYRLPSRRAFLPITAPRTGYAWLFKSVCLQDLLDGDYFYMMAGDYGYMIPVLELAGFHGIFIPDILYVYNIKNPIADARVNARLQARNAIEILNKKPYSPAKAPVQFEALQERDKASLILCSDNRPAALSALLYGALRLVRPLAQCSIIYATDQMNREEYNELISFFPGMHWHEVHDGDFATALRQQLLQQSTDFVLLSADTVSLIKPLAINDDIRLLKKTHTVIKYNAIGAETDQAHFALAHLPPVNLIHTCYGWYSTNKKDDWSVSPLAMTLWKKEMLQTMLKKIGSSSLEKLDTELANALDSDHVLGLINNESSVVCQG